MRKTSGRMVRAALFALAAGALVAVANPARPIRRDMSVALVSAKHLTASAIGLAKS